MWELLNLPEKFRVKKKISVESFLRKANLTKTEKEKVGDHLLDIEIKYDIVFSDKSELILIDALFDDLFIKRNYIDRAKYIAQSMPYPCLLFVHSKSVGTICGFITRLNKQNTGRSLVEKQSASPEFILKSPHEVIKDCILNLHSILVDRSLDILSVVEKCITAIETAKQFNRISFRFDSMKTALNSLEYRIAEKIEQGFSMKEQDFSPYYDTLIFNTRLCLRKSDDSDYYEFPHILCYSDIKLAEEELCECSYYFYYEYCKYNDLTPVDDSFSDEIIKWLVEYSELCQELIKEGFNGYLTDKFYYHLGACFAKRDITAYNEYETNDLVVMLYSFLFEEL